MTYIRSGNYVTRIVMLALVALLVQTVVLPVQAEVYLFQQGVNGYTGHGGTSDSGDNYFIGSEGGNGAHLNYGHSPELRLSGSANGSFYNYWLAIAAQSVWKDIIGTEAGQVPAGSTINSAKLRLYAYQTISADENVDVGMNIYSWAKQQYPGMYNGQIPTHAVDPDTSVWGSTRLYRIYYTNGWDNVWWVPEIGYDTTSATPWDTVTVTADDHDTWQPHWIEFDVTDAVQGWVDGTADNYGFALFTDTSWAGFYFHSSEYGSTDAEMMFRPTLVIDVADTEPHGRVYSFQQGVDGYYGNGNAADRGDAQFVTYQGGTGQYHYRNYGRTVKIEAGGSDRPDQFNYWSVPCSVTVWKDYVGSGPDQVPAGTAIVSAKLRLYAYEIFNSDENVDVGLEVYSPAKQVWPGLYDDAIPAHAGDYPNAPDGWASTAACRRFWSESWDGDAWWMPKKGIDTSQSTPWDTAVVTDAAADQWTGGWVELDVTEPVQAVIDGTDPNNYGFMLFTNTYWAGFRFHSAEAVDKSLRPQLVITLAPQTCDDVYADGYSLIGDLNQDCRVDMLDLQLFQVEWSASNP